MSEIDPSSFGADNRYWLMSDSLINSNVYNFEYYKEPSQVVEFQLENVMDGNYQEVEDDEQFKHLDRKHT